MSLEIIPGSTLLPQKSQSSRNLCIYIPIPANRMNYKGQISPRVIKQQLACPLNLHPGELIKLTGNEISFKKETAPYAPIKARTK